MARIAGVDIPKNKRGVIALTYIFGVGKSRAIEILEKAMKNEAVRIALENVKEAQDQLTIIAHLSREYETTN